MERMTVKWKLKLYDVLDPIDIVDNEYSKINYEKMLVKLGEYEDAEEQGLLPKFHLGDEFWTIHWNGVRKEKIVMLQQKKDGTWKYRFPTTADYEENEFGKYFFNTKEEAEQALKQREE